MLHNFGELGGSFARGRPSLAICIYSDGAVLGSQPILLVALSIHR